MAAKTLKLTSPDGKVTRDVDSPTQETTLKWQGWTVAEDSEIQSLAAKKGPAEKTPVTAIDTPSAGEQTPTEAGKGGKAK